MFLVLFDIFIYYFCIRRNFIEQQKIHNMSSKYYKSWKNYVMESSAVFLNAWLATHAGESYLEGAMWTLQKKKMSWSIASIGIIANGAHRIIPGQIIRHRIEKFRRRIALTLSYSRLSLIVLIQKNVFVKSADKKSWASITI